MHPFLMQPMKVLQIGLLHPLIVHLPIGILFFAILLSLLPKTLRNSLQKAQQIALLAGAISAIIASITGYLLSRSGDYDLSAVAQHQWSGILTSVFTLLALLIKKIQRLLIWICMVCLSVTGHWGGELTHGDGYLDALFKTTASPSTEQIDEVNFLADTLQSHPDTIQQSQKYSPYQSNVAPLLEANCYSCHSSRKKKGGLRLDSEQWIRAGGKNGLILTSGNPEKSVLFTHLRLPLEDEKHMPPKGKKQLNGEEINTIFQWIKMGAPFGAIERSSTLETTTIVQPDNTSIIQQDSQQIIIQEIEKLTPLKAADPTIIQSLVSQEIVIKPIANRENGLYVSLMNNKKITPEIINKLSALKDQVVELKLNETMISDESLQFLSEFKQLKTLNLNQTTIGDDAIMHIKDLPELQYLNLYGTRVTDHSLEQIKLIKKIRKVNLWNTGISEKEIQRFNKTHPEITIEYGQLRLIKKDSLQKQ
jgi:uncharacterized membrane protein